MECLVNRDLTLKLYKENRMDRLIEKGSCYANIFRVTTSSRTLMNKFLEGKYKVALCYIHNNFPVWVRHLVAIDENNQVLDFTLANKNNNFKYEVVKTFNYEEYQEILDNAYNESDETYYCDLRGLKEEYDFYINATLNDLFLSINEHDYYTYIFPLIDKYGYPEGYEEAIRKLRGC